MRLETTGISFYTVCSRVGDCHVPNDSIRFQFGGLRFNSSLQFIRDFFFFFFSPTPSLQRVLLDYQSSLTGPPVGLSSRRKQQYMM